jgi:hypothetical protein
MKIDTAGTRLRWSRNCVVVLASAFFLITPRLGCAAPILGSMVGFTAIATVAPNSATTLSALISVGTLDDNCFVLGNCPKIALLEGIDSSAVGIIFTLDSGSADFAGVIAQLTDGALDGISSAVVAGPSYGVSSGGGIWFPETDFGTAPDFAGQTIGSIALLIDAVTFGPSPISDGNLFRLDYTLSVYGEETAEVPEPATWLTLASAGGVLVLTRRKRV